MIFKKIKLLVILVVLFFTASSVFAVEEYISNIYKQIDQIFIIKSESQLNSVLSDNNEDKNYYLIENYTEKKIRRLIVNNDYDFAMTAIVIVIENNIDNEQAVEMYSVIADAYKLQQEHEAEVEYQRQLEVARLEKEKEKQRVAVDKEYVAAKNTSSGKQVYVTGKETNLTSYKWKIDIGLADISFLYDGVGKITNLHYGPAIGFNYEYTLENKANIGAELFASIQPLGIPISNENALIPLLADADASLKFAPSALPNFFFSAGFGAIVTGKPTDSVEIKTVADTMYTPLVGIKLERIPLGRVKVDLGADWYAGHLFYNNIKFAMGADMNLQFPFADLEKVSLSLNVGIRDKFIMKDAGIENRASLILAVGVENVIK